MPLVIQSIICEPKHLYGTSQFQHNAVPQNQAATRVSVQTKKLPSGLEIVVFWTHNSSAKFAYFSNSCSFEYRLLTEAQRPPGPSTETFRPARQRKRTSGTSCQHHLSLTLVEPRAPVSHLALTLLPGSMYIRAGSFLCLTRTIDRVLAHRSVREMLRVHCISSSP